ncbi:molybdopterin molybdotransferase MoeA [soil metagenome]
MISYPEALEKIKQQVLPLESERVEVNQALGRVNVHAIESPLNLPSFRNSAMDGYAIRSKDLQHANAIQPVRLKLLAKTYAGHKNPSIPNPVNTAVKVMTGAIVNDCYDAVVPIENILSSDAAFVSFHQPIKVGTNIREVGADFIKDQVIVNPDVTVTAEYIMALASINLKKITVYRNPKFSIISTGKELIKSKQKILNSVGIFDSNGPYIQSFLQQKGYPKINKITYITDSPKTFANHLAKLNVASQKTDVIISTGAVSAGEIDFIPAILRDMGALIVFHKVAIRPGKPILFAVLKNGSYYFGLPGNPMSAAIGMQFFVYPLLNWLKNQVHKQPMMVRLAHGIQLSIALCFFLKAKININSQGEPSAEILAGQESFKILPLLQANAFIMLSDGTRMYQKGEWVPAYFL